MLWLMSCFMLRISDRPLHVVVSFDSLSFTSYWKEFADIVESDVCQRVDCCGGSMGEALCGLSLVWDSKGRATSEDLTAEILQLTARFHVIWANIQRIMGSG